MPRWTSRTATTRNGTERDTREGLRGEQIPLAARIFAVPDVYDALTSARPYRHAWTTDRALAYIRENRGTHFDPRVVEVFLNQGSV